MKHEYEDTIDLGTVRVDTRGKLMGFADVEEGQQVSPSLNDD